jgi:hypothetical protein
MKKRIVLLSKEVLLPEYIGVYGGKYWLTPNIDELANKGTIFQRHYTAAPSTAMAFTSMHTGIYPYQTDRKDYVQVDDDLGVISIFQHLESLSYETHVIWSTNYGEIKDKYTRTYGLGTIFHDDFKFNQSVGVHLNFSDNIINRNEEKADISVNYVINEIKKLNHIERLFLWIHLPHVMDGRISYGDDIDLVDRIVGQLRESFGDDSIYITGDHGHMNMSKMKTTYGFDVYENAIKVPLITPKINNQSIVNYPTSHVQLFDFIVKNEITKLDYIVVDTAYYAQPFRKIALISGDYKLIYNKQSKDFEFYDVVWDTCESNNLLKETIYDFDRQRKVRIDQVYFYPHREQSLMMYKYLYSEFFEHLEGGTFFSREKELAY